MWEVDILKKCRQNKNESSITKPGIDFSQSLYPLECKFAAGVFRPTTLGKHHVSLRHSRIPHPSILVDVREVWPRGPDDHDVTVAEQLQDGRHYERRK